MEAENIKPWLFRVQPYQGESLSYFLGRFRRANDLTPTGLGKAAEVGGAIARWEKFRFNPPPSRQQLEALAKVVRLDADRLAQMLPPAGVGMKLEPIRLCAACYVESPCHKIEWQLKITQECDRHKLSLLSECPNCGARFKIPAAWVDGWCQRCFLSFADMVKYQKSYR
ncbi:TniQ family protein [Nostoc sp. FACHB-888]|uniref:TniQ family protein n=1 Tax=Nostoc sp. FACHB-888 TaxID=2692842 RepID=UPI001682DCE4|nr:TniQ family protein [Nostoc sp. FACHB-888]MBD2242356.1 TniQ family protein [Nostoc sp. FACHB-888]